MNSSQNLNNNVSESLHNAVMSIIFFYTKYNSHILYKTYSIYIQYTNIYIHIHISNEKNRVIS